MNGKVWMSSMKSNSELGDKPGLRIKYFGEEWSAAKHALGAPGHERLALMRKNGQGFVLQRDEFPEAAAVFDEECFARRSEIFAVAGFYVVRGKLADVLLRFDLGEGGLVPFPIYKADLATPHGGEFFLLNFGARKNTFVPSESKSVAKLALDRKTGKQIWKVNSWREHGDVAVSADALVGPDIWFEESVHSKIFMSNALATALADTKDANEWRLVECKVVETQS